MNPGIHALASKITEKFIASAPKEAAVALAGLATHEVLLLISGLKAQTLVAVLNPMDPAKAAAILRRLPFKQAGYVLTHLQVSQAAKLWKEFSAPYQERLKEVLAPAFIGLLCEKGGFPAHAVGAHLRTDVVAVRTETTVAELVKQLKNLPRTKLPPVCFVTGKNGELKGTIRTVELVFLNPQAVCGSVMGRENVTVKPHETVQEVAPRFAQAQTDALAVVDENGLLVGMLAKAEALACPPAPKTLWEKIKG